jgi:hypothetical protein
VPPGIAVIERLAAVTTPPVMPARSHSVPEATQNSSTRFGTLSLAMMSEASSGNPSVLTQL